MTTEAPAPQRVHPDTVKHKPSCRDHTLRTFVGHHGDAMAQCLECRRLHPLDEPWMILPSDGEQVAAPTPPRRVAQPPEPAGSGGENTPTTGHDDRRDTAPPRRPAGWPTHRRKARAQQRTRAFLRR